MKKFDDLKVLAGLQIEKILGSFPQELQAIANIPIILEKAPSLQDQSEGVDDDVMGLFLGPSLAEIGNSDTGQAPHILLYLENIWEEAGEDDEIFKKEVEITLLHELGHYLNWDEDDLEERGLG